MWLLLPPLRLFFHVDSHTPKEILTENESRMQNGTDYLHFLQILPIVGFLFQIYRNKETVIIFELNSMPSQRERERIYMHILIILGSPTSD